VVGQDGGTAVRQDPRPACAITGDSGDAMHAVNAEQLAEISRRIALRMVSMSGLDCSSVALDMTNFAAFTGTGNGKAPIARRGKAKQKRCDLRLVGLGLVVTQDGGIPLTWHAYPRGKPDVTQFPAMVDQLRGQLTFKGDQGA
jgi:transposase